MRVLVTGMAGFIGYHVSLRLAKEGHHVYGVDNINDYYDVGLKYDRLKELGISQEESSIELKECFSNKFENIKFKKIDLANSIEINNLFKKEKFDKVCHLAAQAGVRYSLENPKSYIDSNITGFINILEGCRHHKVKHIVYASSSSVYGNSKERIFSEDQNVDFPISLYAASKKSNELIANVYSHLFKIQCIGLRFFTVYGPWGRPDMASFLFTEAIKKGDPIQVFNYGDLKRDFTYIDDVTEGVIKTLLIKSNKKSKNEVYNIGNNRPIKLNHFIKTLEKKIGRKAIVKLLPMQKGDVYKTAADLNKINKDYGFQPSTSIEDGLGYFIEWHNNYTTKA